MTWLKKDDRFPEHRKVRRLSDGAYRLHDTAMCFVAHDESDGMIRTDDIEEMQHGHRLHRRIADLIDAGLWEPVVGGWMIHDFLDYNPSHEQLEAERAASRDRQARLRAKRRGVAEEVESHAVSHAVTPPDVTRESHRVSRDPVPSRTVPSRTDPFVGVLRSVVDGETSSSSSPFVSREPGVA